MLADLPGDGRGNAGKTQAICVVNRPRMPSAAPDSRIPTLREPPRLPFALSSSISVLHLRGGHNGEWAAAVQSVLLSAAAITIVFRARAPQLACKCPSPLRKPRCPR